MLNSISIFEVAVYLMLTQYKWFFVFLYIISHAVYVYYFWMNGTKFPILGFVPFVRVFLYRSLSGLNMALIVFYCIFSAASLYLPSIVLWTIWVVLSILLELKFAQVCIDDKHVLYALCPPYKLVRLVLDAKALSASEE